MSELDLAKKLFGTSNRNTGYSSAPSRIQNQGVTTTVGTSSTRYGTVQAIGDNNYLTILLDGSDEPIKAYCETPVVVGQRVSVVIGNNTITVIALQSFVEQVQQNQEQTNTKFQEIQQQGEELAASVAEDIQEVQDSLDDFKSTHSYTDAQIDTKFEQAEDTITANVEAAIGDEFVTDAELEIAVGEIETTVSQNYQSKTDAGTMQSNLQSQITQNANAITQEVSDRKTAVTGAVTESKTYTDTTAEGLKTTISESVMNEVGETYTKQADFSATVDGLTATFTQSIGEVEDKADAAQSTANSAQSAASKAQTTANTAQTTATNAQTAASNAQSTANTAKTTADNASKTASTAQSTANTAKTTADSASKTASSAQSTANTANSTANTAKSTADAAKSTADKVNQTVSTVITSDANGVTVGRSDLANSARVSSSAEFQILKGSSKITTIGQNEIHLGMNLQNIKTSKFYMFNDIFQINTEPVGGVVYDGYYDLTIQPSDTNADTSKAASIGLKLHDDAFIEVSDSMPSLPSSSPQIILTAPNINMYGDEDIAIYPDGSIQLQGDATVLASKTIIKPAFTLGLKTGEHQTTTSNTQFPANYVYGYGDTQHSTSFLNIYRSGNYIIVDVPRCGVPSGQWRYNYVPVSVSAQVTTQNVNNTNVAAEIHIEHISGNAGSLSVDTIASPIQTGSSFVAVYITPTVIRLPRASNTASSSYDRYRFSLWGRSSNGSALVTNWAMTVSAL